MRIYITNAAMVSAVKGKMTTTLILEERGGQEIELVFSSLRVLELFGDEVCEAVDAILDARAGSIWYGEAGKRRLQRAAGRAMFQDALHDSGFLERPPFLRPLGRPSVNVTGTRSPFTDEGPESPRPSSNPQGQTGRPETGKPPTK